MKKILTVLFLIAMIGTTLCVFAACGNDKDQFECYEAIEDDTYRVGDKFNESDAEILAKYADGTTKSVEKNLIFDGKDDLKLDDNGCFTEESKGTHKITVYALEKRDDYKIGEWTIICK